MKASEVLLVIGMLDQSSEKRVLSEVKGSKLSLKLLPFLFS